MTTLHFFAQGLPKAQPRARATRRGQHAGVYDPGSANDWKTTIKTAAWEQVTAATAIAATATVPVFSGPIRLDATFYFPRPRAHFRGKSAQIRLDAPCYHTHKPDRDNLDKALLDALTDVQVLRDDAQVAAGSLTKLYALPGQAAGVRVHILSLQETQ